MPLMTVNQDILEVAYQVAGDRIEGALYNAKKVERSKAVNALNEEVKAAVLEKVPGSGQVRHLAGVRLRAEKSLPHQRARQTEAHGWPRLSGFAPDQLRSRRAPARPWFRDFPARRNASARARHARADRRSAEHRRLRWRRNLEELHASLQLPAVQRRAKPAAPAAPAGARSATARSPSVRSSRLFPARKLSVTRFASPAKSWNPTAPPRWPASAAACSR